MRKLVLTMMILLIVGCASAPISWRAEPNTIIVRNHSGVPLARVALRTLDPKDNSLAGVGEVSPVARGSSQVLARRADPPPLPAVLEILWTERPGRQYSEKVAMEPILETATGEPGERLIFEIRPAGELTVYCESRDGEKSP